MVSDATESGAVRYWVTALGVPRTQKFSYHKNKGKPYLMRKWYLEEAKTVLDGIEMSFYRCRMARSCMFFTPAPRKRHTTMQKFVVSIEDTGEKYTCAGMRSVLEGMEALGKKGIPVGCRQGGCGVCKVQILEGQYARRVMSRAHVSAEEEAAGCVLSCRIYPTSDLRLQVVGAMKKNVCRPLAAPPSTHP